MKQLWLDVGWKHKTSLRDFIRKHNRWTTIVGAAIVFAMFVVKDAYRESLKEIVSSISEAQKQFVTTETLRGISQQIARIDKKISAAPNEVHDNSFEALFETDPNILSSLVIGSAEEIENLLRLVNAIPGEHKEELENLLSFKNYIDTRQKSFETPTTPPGGVVSDKINNDVAHVRRLAIMATVVSDALTWKGVQGVHHVVILEAEEERTQRERRVHQATVASYVLYPLGLIVGLIAKLWGQDESDFDV